MNKNTIREVSKDISSIKVTGDKTFNQLIKEFYAILAKHNIKMHTKIKGKPGMTGANFEYTICKTLFVEQITSSFIFLEWDIPEKKFFKMPKKVMV